MVDPADHPQLPPAVGTKIPPRVVRWIAPNGFGEHHPPGFPRGEHDLLTAGIMQTE